MLLIITYNCFNIQDVCDLCNSYNLIFLQETWLFEHELHYFPTYVAILNDSVLPLYMDISNGIFSGRPHGEVAILIRKSIRKACQLHSYNDSRLLGITVNIVDTSCYYINVYMPYQCDNNYDLYVEYIEKISSLIEDSVTSNLIVLGDFNAAVNTLFEFELVNMCNTHQLVVSDFEAYGQDSGQFTYMSDAHFTT